MNLDFIPHLLVFGGFFFEITKTSLFATAQILCTELQIILFPMVAQSVRLW